MRVIKRDFVNPDTPSYCDNRKLTSGKAYFLLDSAGRIFKAGEQCAKQHSQTDLSSVPDLTTSLLVNSTKDKHDYSSRLNSKQQKLDKKSQALTYLLLREEKLKELGFENISYNTLQSYYQEYKNNYDLSEEAVNHIYNILNSPNIPKKFSLLNLSTCYAYYYKMEKALQCLNQEQSVYIDSLLKYLKKDYSLTKPQIDGLAKWFEHINCKEIKEAKLKNFMYDNFKYYHKTAFELFILK
ncbi:hypothetical protein [uncultured Helicobacter sp.]|uniref:hypothetical protein n=1 Tax=uncultured Helicobacter sp. TaxID=175537 RepID=UPI00261A9E8B|nr:hypothetical protein [uncultured Helicobacter sp.]